MHMNCVLLKDFLTPCIKLEFGKFNKTNKVELFYLNISYIEASEAHLNVDIYISTYFPSTEKQ